jgi:hypothetical protein
VLTDTSFHTGHLMANEVDYSRDREGAPRDSSLLKEAVLVHDQVNRSRNQLKVPALLSSSVSRSLFSRLWGELERRASVDPITATFQREDSRARWDSAAIRSWKIWFTPAVSAGPPSACIEQPTGRNRVELERAAVYVQSRVSAVCGRPRARSILTAWRRQNRSRVRGSIQAKPGILATTASNSRRKHWYPRFS